MPKLEILHFGHSPCKAPADVTIKGLAALASYCLRLSGLRVHFQVAGLDPSEIPQVISGGEPTIPREDCALTCLEVGDIYMPDESTLMVTLTLLRIFPRLDDIKYTDQRWKKVAHAIRVSKKLADHSSKKHSFDTPRRNADDTPFRSHTRERCSAVKRVEVSEGSRFNPAITQFRILPTRICCVILALLYLIKWNITKVNRLAIVRAALSVSVN